jgi:hypothetical protein
MNRVSVLRSCPVVAIMVLVALVAIVPALGGHTAASAATGLEVEAVLPASADARVRAWKEWRNFGNNRLTEVHGPEGWGGEVRTYLMFDASGLSAPVESATVQLWTSSDGGLGAVYATSLPWNERLITWSNRPPRERLVTELRRSIGRERLLEFDVSEVVKGPGIYSFVITGWGAGVWLYARESAKPPRLVLKN